MEFMLSGENMLLFDRTLSFGDCFASESPLENMARQEDITRRVEDLIPSGCRFQRGPSRAPRTSDQPVPTRPMHFSTKIILVGAAFASSCLAATETAPLPWQSTAWGAESGVLWEHGHSTPFRYRMLQTQFSWRSSEVRMLGHKFADGSRLIVRHRLTLLGMAIQNGPESHYIAFSGSPSVEWWNRAASWSFFTGAGGGFGGIDSRGIKGGQGQDFTLNWFARIGVERVASRNLRLSAAIMFQHLSNGGQTKQNPGIDGLGFMLGGAWSR
jgi:hypothetical protein